MLWRVPVRAWAPSAMGLGVATDPCTAVRNLPVLKEIMSKFGCSPGGRALAKAGITVAATVYAPTVGPIVGQIGAEAVMNCLCDSNLRLPPIDVPPPVQAQSILKSPIALAGLGALAVGAAVLLSKRKKTPPPQIIVVPAPASPKS